jgi:hypothetical protein
MKILQSKITGTQTSFSTSFGGKLSFILSCLFPERLPQQSFFFFFEAKFRQNGKNNFFKGVFCLRFFENLEKNRQKSRGFELVSPDLEALLLWIVK